MPGVQCPARGAAPMSLFLVGLLSALPPIAGLRADAKPLAKPPLGAMAATLINPLTASAVLAAPNWLGGAAGKLGGAAAPEVASPAMAPAAPQVTQAPAAAAAGSTRLIEFDPERVRMAVSHFSDSLISALKGALAPLGVDVAHLELGPAGWLCAALIIRSLVVERGLNQAVKREQDQAAAAAAKIEEQLAETEANAQAERQRLDDKLKAEAERVASLGSSLSESKLSLRAAEDRNAAAGQVIQVLVQKREVIERQMRVLEAPIRNVWVELEKTETRLMQQQEEALAAIESRRAALRERESELQALVKNLEASQLQLEEALKPEEGKSSTPVWDPFNLSPTARQQRRLKSIQSRLRTATKELEMMPDKEEALSEQEELKVERTAEKIELLRERAEERIAKIESDETREEKVEELRQQLAPFDALEPEFGEAIAAFSAAQQLETPTATQHLLLTEASAE